MLNELTPRQIVTELDRYIIGQEEAKKSVAIALRNRWRRLQVPADLQSEIVPKNILMIGPTGVGKTEIARRLAKLAHAPFIKVEATKYTEVGYVGKDVESMIRDLTSVAMKMVREEELKRNQDKAGDAAEERVLDLLLPPRSGETQEEKDGNSARQMMRKKLREGQLDDREVEIEVSPADNKPSGSLNIIGAGDISDMSSQLSDLFQSLGQERKVRRRMKIKDAMKVLTEEEADKLTKTSDLKGKAVELTENSGIVFIDEIDKICHGNFLRVLKDNE